MFPFGQSIVLVRRTSSGTDDFGDETGTATEETVLGAFAPAGSAEANGTGVVTQPTVYLSGSADDLTYLDAVKVDGVTYEISGQPIPWTNPFTGWDPGVEVRLSSRET